MDDTLLVKCLKDLGTPTTIDQLRRYAAQGLIAAPPIRYQRRRKKLGRPPNPVKAEKKGGIIQKAQLGRLPRDWTEQALEEAAAVWAVRHARDSQGNYILLSGAAKILKGVRLVASSLHPIYRIKDRMIDHRWEDGPFSNPFTYKDVEMKLHDNDTLHQLTVTYIGAKEKARRGTPVTTPMRVILMQDILERVETPMEGSASKAIFDRKLARSAKKKGRRLTPDEVRLAERTHEQMIKTISTAVSSRLDIDLEPTDAVYDEIELWVRQPGSNEFVDSRKLVMRCDPE